MGLDYVGMPLGVAFAIQELNVIGFFLNKKRLSSIGYRSGIDPTRVGGDDVIRNTAFEFTFDEVRFHVIAVPMSMNVDQTPDLTLVTRAGKIVGRNLTKGSSVIYESTVYPRITEDICIPILEKMSGLKCGVDFKVGYSPERINPGDGVHRLANIHKIVSGIDRNPWRK